MRLDVGRTGDSDAMVTDETLNDTVTVIKKRERESIAVIVVVA